MIKVAGIVFSYYPQDVRPRRESEALVEAGMLVDIICLRLDGQKSEENVNGVNVYRLPMRRTRAGKLNYVIQYITFIIKSFIKLSLLHIRKKYNIIHVHNMPDILVVSAILPKLSGSKIILDLHDPMPELFMTKYSVSESHPVIRFLAFMESFSISFADLVITPNISFRNLFISRGCPEEKISIVMNSPIEKIFSDNEEATRQPVQKDPNKFIIMFHGTIFERHGVDTALEAIANLKNEIPGIEFRVFGYGEYVDSFLELVKMYQMENVVKYYGPVSWEQISKEIKMINVGIIPNKKSPFTDLNFPVRIFEYLSLGKAVIAPMTKGILDYFDENSIFFFEAGDSLSLCNTILDVYHNEEKRHEVVGRGMKIYHQHRWELQKQSFIEQVTGLTN
jgi:glycosyltransferase involved in cell wall biosynthesis